MAKNGKKMAKIGGKILGSNIYLCKKIRNSADMEVDRVAAMVADMVADNEKEININLEIQFGYGGWLVGPKLVLSEAYPACASSHLCKFFLAPFPWKMRKSNNDD